MLKYAHFILFQRILRIKVGNTTIALSYKVKYIWKLDKWRITQFYAGPLPLVANSCNILQLLIPNNGSHQSNIRTTFQFSRQRTDSYEVVSHSLNTIFNYIAMPNADMND